LAQIPAIVQHVHDQLNAVQQQKKGAGDEAFEWSAAAKAPRASPQPLPPAPQKRQLPRHRQAGDCDAQNLRPALRLPSPPRATAKTGRSSHGGSCEDGSCEDGSCEDGSCHQSGSPCQHDPFAKTVARKPVRSRRSPPPPFRRARARKRQPLSRQRRHRGVPGRVQRRKRRKGEGIGLYHRGQSPRSFRQPVVQHLGAPVCSTGKRCLAIDQSRCAESSNPTVA